MQSNDFSTCATLLIQKIEICKKSDWSTEPVDDFIKKITPLDEFISEYK